MIMYNSIWSLLIQWISFILPGKKESVLPVCDKPYHTNNGIMQKWEEI